MAPASVRARAAAGTLALGAAVDELALAVGLADPVVDGDADPDDVTDGLAVGVAPGSASSPHADSPTAAMDRATTARPQDLFTVTPHPGHLSRTAFDFRENRGDRDSSCPQG